MILAGRSTRAALVTVPLGGTAGVAIPWAWWASRSDETGLWLVGLIILVIGVWVGLSIAVVLAAVNIFGGFLVTNRMLAMYKKKN